MQIGDGEQQHVILLLCSWEKSEAPNFAGLIMCEAFNFNPQVGLGRMQLARWLVRWVHASFYFTQTGDGSMLSNRADNALLALVSAP